MKFQPDPYYQVVQMSAISEPHDPAASVRRFGAAPNEPCTYVGARQLHQRIYPTFAPQIY